MSIRRRHVALLSRIAAENENSGSFREQAARLDALFFKRDEPTGTEPQSTGASQPAAFVPLSPGTFVDLPLWRVQWATLPGTQEVLHVHVPHYTHMFESIIAGDRPWRFGHIYLPGGSASLGTPAAAIHPPSGPQLHTNDSSSAARSPEDVEAAGAPSVGSLMEIISALRLGDGRLMILAYGVGRIQVEGLTQSVPFSKGRCRLLPDKEETVAAESLAVHVVGDAPTGASLMSVMAATVSATDAAAVASAQVWQDWEVAAVLQHAGAGVTAADAVENFAAIHRMERHTTVVPIADSAGGLRGMGSVHVAAAEAAQKAATMAAAAAWEGPDDTSDVQQNLFGTRDRISGMSSKRGISSKGISADIQQEADRAAGNRRSDVSAIAGVLEAEAAVWAELDLVVSTAGRLKLRQLALPAGLLSLRPPPVEADAEGSNSNTDSCDEDSSDDELDDASGIAPSAAVHCPPEYPPLRRAQRLSFAMPSILPDINPAEGQQALLEAGSIEIRLGLIHTALRKHRKVLAALALLRGLEPP